MQIRLNFIFLYKYLSEFLMCLVWLINMEKNWSWERLTRDEPTKNDNEQ
jgi:hypothetical protein